MKEKPGGRVPSLSSDWMAGSPHGCGRPQVRVHASRPRSQGDDEAARLAEDTVCVWPFVIFPKATRPAALVSQVMGTGRAPVRPRAHLHTGGPEPPELRGHSTRCRNSDPARRGPHPCTVRRSCAGHRLGTPGPGRHCHSVCQAQGLAQHSRGAGGSSGPWTSVLGWPIHLPAPRGLPVSDGLLFSQI